METQDEEKEDSEEKDSQQYGPKIISEWLKKVQKNL
jgi:hypothetical protein